MHRRSGKMLLWLTNLTFALGLAAHLGCSPPPIQQPLPPAEGEACRNLVLQDVYLLVDLSASMAERVAGGGTRLDSVKRAAHAFVEVTPAGQWQMALGLFASGYRHVWMDEVGLATIDDEPPSSTREQLQAVIDVLRINEDHPFHARTDVEAGLNGASAFFNRSQARYKTILVMSDGIFCWREDDPRNARAFLTACDHLDRRTRRVLEGFGIKIMVIGPSELGDHLSSVASIDRGGNRLFFPIDVDNYTAGVVEAFTRVSNELCTPILRLEIDPGNRNFPTPGRNVDGVRIPRTQDSTNLWRVIAEPGRIPEEAPFEILAWASEPAAGLTVVIPDGTPEIPRRILLGGDNPAVVEGKVDLAIPAEARFEDKEIFVGVREPDSGVFLAVHGFSISAGL